MADDLILTDDEFDALRAQLRPAWRRTVGTELPDVLEFALATQTDNTTRVFSSCEFAEPPEWAPFLPVAGVYGHPVYGDMDLTLATYERMVANFKDGVYQDKLPVNAEHDITASGAVGWITDLRINPDTSIDARVEWNDRGKALIEGDRFRYVSAEFITEWIDPVDGTAYGDVASGLAITTQPYFKESVLRPLVASDAVWTYRRDNRQGADGMTNPNDAATKDTPKVVQLSESELIELREAKRTADALTVKLAEAEARANDTQTQLAEIRTKQRVKAFTDEVRGRSDANNRPWFGEPEAHVAHLVKLSEAFGDESPEVQHYVTTSRAAAEQLHKSNLFTAVGSSASAEPATALDEVNARAAEIAKASGGAMTHAQAFSQVITTDAELASRYMKER